MMNRRLNKKVAIIGSGVFLLLLLAAIAVMLQLGQSSEELLKDAETALQSTAMHRISKRNSRITSGPNAAFSEPSARRATTQLEKTSFLAWWI